MCTQCVDEPAREGVAGSGRIDCSRGPRRRDRQSALVAERGRSSRASLHYNPRTPTVQKLRHGGLDVTVPEFDGLIFSHEHEVCTACDLEELVSVLPHPVDHGVEHDQLRCPQSHEHRSLRTRVGAAEKQGARMAQRLGYGRHCTQGTIPIRAEGLTRAIGVVSGVPAEGLTRSTLDAGDIDAELPQGIQQFVGKVVTHDAEQCDVAGVSGGGTEVGSRAAKDVARDLAAALGVTLAASLNATLSATLAATLNRVERNRAESDDAGPRRALAHTSMPANAAVSSAASSPANIALRPRRARSWRRFGAISPTPAMVMATDPKLAKVARA